MRKNVRTKRKIWIINSIFKEGMKKYFVMIRPIRDPRNKFPKMNKKANKTFFEML